MRQTLGKTGRWLLLLLLVGQSGLGVSAAAEGLQKRDWQKESQMGMQWDVDEKLEETLERRRMEGSSLQVDVMQHVPEFAVHPSVKKSSAQKKRRK